MESGVTCSPQMERLCFVHRGHGTPHSNSRRCARPDLIFSPVARTGLESRLPPTVMLCLVQSITLVSTGSGGLYLARAQDQGCSSRRYNKKGARQTRFSVDAHRIQLSFT